MKEEFKIIVQTLKEEAKKGYQRRMIVICGDSEKKMELAAECINEFFLEEPEAKILYLSDNLSENTFSYRRFMRFKDLLESKISVKRVEFGKTKRILGTTFDGLVIDATYDFRADDIGRIIETVRGGGIIVLITPPFNIWKKTWLIIHRSFITPPYTMKDLKHLFIPRVIRKLKEHPGIVIFDADKEKVIKPISWSFEFTKKERTLTSEILPNEIVKISKTQDQINCIENIYKYFISPTKVFILISDRGRGKTASLGISVAFLIYKDLIKRKVIITAPEYDNILPFFDFLKLTLDKLNIKYKVVKRGIIEIYEKKITVMYRKPIDVVEKIKGKIDLLIVDEAASFPTTFLFKTLQMYNKIIYSSTIHGYEGAGRGFSVRFLGRLKKQNLASYQEFKMEEPIRYAEGDFIEKWLYDTLLLDAEPEKLDEKDIEDIKNLNLKFEHPNLKEWFEENDKDLRAYFGIYILAHYRNSPLDLQLLADAPHHDAFVTRTSTGKIVNAIQIAYEGGLSKEVAKKILHGFDPSGNLIPCKVGQNYQDEYFPTTRGMRIVRIATHPDYQGKGIGSKALEFLEEYAKKRNFDWLGSGFGATAELLRFWIRNGFYPVHISPLRQTSSGEYSVIVIKPINERLKRIIPEYNFAFKYKLMGSLLDAHRNLDLDTALVLLETCAYNKEYFEKKAPKFSIVELKEIEAFINEATCYETVYGLLRKLAMIYFLDPKRPELDELDKKILIAKLLQNKKWKEVKKELGISRRTIIKRLREIAKILINKYQYLIS